MSTSLPVRPGAASTRVSSVLIVVPAHNEQLLLARSLDAIGVAVRRAAESGIRCAVRVVLDGCTDDSAAIAQRYPFPIITIDERRVGAARAVGVAHGLAGVAPREFDSTWIANTDADSQVPPDWILAHTDAANRGADVLLGLVRPDFADLSPAHRQHWLSTHPLGEATGNTHGANLGVRASVYREAGGFDPVLEHEDVGLVERCRKAGARIHASAVIEVLTSGRVKGRTPGGYAGFVRQQAARFPVVAVSPS